MEKRAYILMNKAFFGDTSRALGADLIGTVGKARHQHTPTNTPTNTHTQTHTYTDIDFVYYASVALIKPYSFVTGVRVVVCYVAVVMSVRTCNI
jgi:hypothetical protein